MGLPVSESSEPMFIPLPPGLEFLVSATEQACSSPYMLGSFGRFEPQGVSMPETFLQDELASVPVPLDAASKTHGRAMCGAPAWKSPGGPLRPRDNAIKTEADADGTLCSPIGLAVSSADTQQSNDVPQVLPGLDLLLEKALTSGKDVSKAFALVDPTGALLRKALGGGGRNGGDGGAGVVRWWARQGLPMLCPLTRFPVCLLPYPPFKLRVDPKRSSPHRLVDGKFLAMTLIVSGDASNIANCEFFNLEAPLQSAVGRELRSSDVSALDEYVQRCKLGPYRPGRAATLAHEIANAATPERRSQASQELSRFVAGARKELEKLRRIQENRVLQLSKALAEQDSASSPEGQGRSRKHRDRGRLSSSASSCGSDRSTRASTQDPMSFDRSDAM